MKKLLLIMITIIMPIINFSEHSSSIKLGVNYTKNKMDTDIGFKHTFSGTSELGYLGPIYRNGNFKLLLGIGLNGQIGYANISEGHPEKIDLIEAYAGPYLTSQISYNLNEYVALRSGVKVGAGLNVYNFTTYNSDTQILTTEVASTLGVPITFVVGADLNRITTDFEVGAKYIKGSDKINLIKENKFVFTTSFSIGYKF